MSEEEYVIDMEDYRCIRVVFSKNKWEEKSKQHPELRNTKFLKNIEKVIEDPEAVWQDYDDPKSKRCYYRKYSTKSYIKVVVWVAHRPCRVVSAYEINWIKEEKYSGLKQLI